MKHLILVCGLALAAVPAVAQNNTFAVSGTEARKASPGQMLSTKLNQLNAYASRNSTMHVNSTLDEIAAIMQQCVADSKAGVGKAPAADKAAVNRQYRTQQQLATDLKQLSANPQKNLSAIQEKVRAFQATL
jgi:hypothetical protein